MEEGRSAFKILTGKPLGRPRCRWEDNIRMDLEENWVDSAQDRDYWRALVNAAFNLRVPKAMELVSSVAYQMGPFLQMTSHEELRKGQGREISIVNTVFGEYINH